MSEHLKMLGSCALLVLVVVALLTYEAPPEPKPDKPAASSTPADANEWNGDPAVVEVKRARCSPDVLAGTVDVRFTLRNRSSSDARVSVFVKRGFHGGNDDGNALDLAEVTVPAHGSRSLGDTYPAHGQRLVRCRLWLGDGGPGGTPDGFVNLPIGAAA